MIKKHSKIQLVKIVWDILKRHGKEDLGLARDIVEALASVQWFEMNGR